MVPACEEHAQNELAPQDDPKDKPEALLASMFALSHEVNASAGRLPVEGVVVARRVLDVVREVIETSAERELDVRAVVSIRGMLEDYLPTTLRAYLAIDPVVVDQRDPSAARRRSRSSSNWTCCGRRRWICSTRPAPTTPTRC